MALSICKYKFPMIDRPLHIVWSIFWFFIPAGIFAQITLKGSVTDANNGQKLPFVSVLVQGKSYGTLTDIEGNFSLTVNTLPVTLIVSCIGYDKNSVTVEEVSSNLKIRLKPSVFQIRDAEVMAGENPALRILRRVIGKKDSLNPEKLESFRYKSYNKLLVTAEKDTNWNSLEGMILKRTYRDSIQVPKNSIDSLFDRQHLFINESVNERIYKSPGRSYEEVLASRTSGIQFPVISALATQIQSLSFYDNQFTLFSTNYVNPISKAGLKQYTFRIIDTTLSGTDTIIRISFEPAGKKSSDLMRGILGVNMTHYALETAIAQPMIDDQAIHITIVQKYNMPDGVHWFPEQLFTKVRSANMNLAGNLLVVECNSYIRDVEINGEIPGGKFGPVSVDIHENATVRDTMIQSNRINDLDTKDSNTYRVVDSVAKALNLEKRLRFVEGLLEGKIRIKFIDIDLDRLLNFNNYEGFRLGLGLSTNKYLVKWMKVGGYFAYGFKDKAFKFGAYNEYILHRKKDVVLRLDFSRDVMEAGYSSFPIEGGFNFDNLYRTVVLGVFDSVLFGEVSLRFKPLPNISMRVSGNYQKVDPTYHYRYEDDTSNYNPQYQFAEAGFCMRFAPGEKFIGTGRGYLAVKNKWPVFWLNFIQGFDLNTQEAAYTKLNLRIDQVFRVNKLGNTYITAEGGYIFNDVVYSRLYNVKGSYASFSLTSFRTFETVRPNEFMSDAYVSLFFKHVFPRLFKLGRWMSPQIAVEHNLGFSTLRNALRHKDVTVKPMEHGLFEAGLLVENFLTLRFTGFGAGVFYRYGAYADSDPLKNLYVKMAITVNLN